MKRLDTYDVCDYFYDGLYDQNQNKGLEWVWRWVRAWDCFGIRFWYGLRVTPVFCDILRFLRDVQIIFVLSAIYVKRPVVPVIPMSYVFYGRRMPTLKGVGVVVKVLECSVVTTKLVRGFSYCLGSGNPWPDERMFPCSAGRFCRPKNRTAKRDPPNPASPQTLETLRTLAWTVWRDV